MLFTRRARRQFAGQQVGDALKVVVARVAKVRGAEAKEHGHRAAVPALVLQQVGTVFGAHLSAGHVAASAAHQLGRVVLGSANFQLASGLAAVVRLKFRTQRVENTTKLRAPTTYTTLFHPVREKCPEDH